MSDFRTTDAPVPFNSDAQFAVWKKSIEERLRSLEHRRTLLIPDPITGTTDALGLLTFFHGAFEVPRAIIVQVQSPTDIWVTSVDTINAQTARVRFFDSSGGTVINFVGSVTFRIAVFL